MAKVKSTKPKKAAAARKKGLTPRENLFWQHYLGAARGNATEAARLAGYTGSDESIRQSACQNLKKPEIREKIDDALSVYALTAAEVLAELSKVARIDVDDDPKQVRNKVQALAHLAKYHGLLTEKIDLTTKGQPITFAALAQLANEESTPGKGNS